MRAGLFFLLALLLGAAAECQVVIYSESFETDGEGTRYTSNTFTDCTNSDFFFRTNTNPVTPPSCSAQFGSTLTNLQGSWFWASEDIRTSSPVPGSRPPGAITTQAITATAYNNLSVSLYLATSNNNNLRWESADSINIQVSFDGVNYRTIGRFMGKGTPVVGARLGIDGNLDGAYTAADPVTDCDVTNFTKYIFPFTGTGSSIRIRLDFDQQGGTEELAIDRVELNGVSTLPVKLYSFSAALQAGNRGLIAWEADPASNPAYFIPQRSADGILFGDVDTVAAGNHSRYTIIDPLPVTSSVFYRLKMLDTDGRLNYSQVVRIGNRNTGDRLMIIQQYPGGKIDGLLVKSENNKQAVLRCFDSNGRMIGNCPVRLQNGQQYMAFPFRLPAAGYYILSLMADDGELLSAKGCTGN